jgi:hypothetical protein
MAEPARARTGRYRDRLRRRGLRPLQLWVPDLRDAQIGEEVRAAVRAVAGHPSSREGEAFVEAALADAADWPE